MNMRRRRREERDGVHREKRYEYERKKRECVVTMNFTVKLMKILMIFLVSKSLHLYTVILCPMNPSSKYKIFGE